ncbi:MAG: hypothetical protein ACRD2W_00450 [Acidimicrobiales bacterium]
MVELDRGAQPAAVDIRLKIRCGDPLTGVVAIDGGLDETPFRGWIALMAIVNEACQNLPPTPDAT